MINLANKLSSITALLTVAIFLALATLTCAQIKPPVVDIELQWDEGRESDLAGYRLFIGNAPGSYSSAYELQKRTRVTVQVDPSRAPFFFAVKAYNLGGQESDFSQEVRYPPLLR